MSKLLISRNADLGRLQQDGLQIEIRGGYLLVHDVPYVNARKEIRIGILASSLTTSGDIVCQQDHTAWLAGEVPCDSNGKPLTKIVLGSNPTAVDSALVLNQYLSSKPIGIGVYAGLYDKMTTYVDLLGAHAQAIDPDTRARKDRPVLMAESESVFMYMDTCSSRARINEVTEKLRPERLAIIGLGGSGGYILDFIAKTPAEQIHLYDGDRFFTHNAFRAPGAASIDDLNKMPFKVDYFATIYSKMRRGIVPNSYYITEENIDSLRDKTFVFVCVDKGSVRDLIFRSLEAWEIPFIDVGMGIGQIGSALEGILRVTTSTPEMRAHIRRDKLVSFTDRRDDDIYDQNIQVADLNAFGAVLAVMRWKKLRGFYIDVDREHHTTLTIDGNMLLNDYKP